MLSRGSLSLRRSPFTPPPLHRNLQLRCRGDDEHGPSVEFSLVSALKSSASSLPSGEQLHSFALKSGLLQSNLFIRNGLINLYSRCGIDAAATRLFSTAPMLDTASWNIMIAMHVKRRRLEDARNLFDKMPERDCVSYTTMIMGLAQHGLSVEALVVLRDMMASGVAPNEVTLATAISAGLNLHEIRSTKMAHGVSVRRGLDVFVLVSTNLVHAYATCSNLEDSEAVFQAMPEKNVVTWNVMLNGYAKAGLIDSAVELFEKIPARDFVSWGTMIDGFLRVNRLDRALLAYREMLRDTDARPNEVMLVDLVSACGRLSAIQDGRQLHAAILVTGLDCHSFVQATLIHFYAACHEVNDAYLLFQSGSQEHVSSWNAIIGGFLRNDMVNAGRRLFDEMPERDVVSWSTLIAGYAQNRQSELALELFHSMLSSHIQPNEITLVSVVSAITSAGTLEEAKWIHSYIDSNSIPLTDNLVAALIDMYAKRGNIRNALQVFNCARETFTSVSPWNAIICGLAIHGHADTSLHLFSELQRTKIRPNSITFIGVLTACCHAGLVNIGKHYFESLKREHNIELTIKHYGCMVDLLARAGQLEEAEGLIEAMPMKADVMIWGSILAAAKTCGNIKIGERAAESLARLEPSHGASRVLLSNIYADEGRWDDAFLVRRGMQSQRLQKVPGCSGIE